MHSGIDRYLYGTAGSSRMLQQVNSRPSAIAKDVIRSPMAERDFHDDAPACPFSIFAVAD